MASLLSDGWFYVSALGFLVSCVFFVLFLGQYRAAVEAAEDEEGADSYEPQPVPLTAPPAASGWAAEDAPAKVVEAVKPAEPAKAAEPVASVPPPVEKTEPPAKKADATATGGFSAGAIQLNNFLQTVKTQMERFDKELGGVKSLVSQQGAQSETALKSQLKRLDEDLSGLKELVGQQAAQNDAILQKLAELTGKLDSRPAPEPAPQAAPAPSEQPAPAETEPVVATAPAQPVAAPVVEAPASGEQFSADKTLEIEQGAAPLNLTPAPKNGEPGATEAEEAPRAARKGPVWPI